MEEIRLVVASPSDVKEERALVALVVDELNRSPDWSSCFTIKTKQWENDSYAGANSNGPQGIIDPQLRIASSHIAVFIFWKRFGTPTDNSQSGTEHEFKTAYKSWKETGYPQIMVYFKSDPVVPIMTDEELKQFARVTDFRNNKLPEEVFAFSFSKALDFERQFRQHLIKQLSEIKNNPISRTSTGNIAAGEWFSQKDLPPENIDELTVAESEGLYSSFHPHSNGSVFIRIKVPTTPGFIEDDSTGGLRKTENNIYLVRDPVRPFEIQIGEQRSLRQRGTADSIPFVEDLTVDVLEGMYPFIADVKHRWLRMVFAELASNEEVLRYIYNNKNEDHFVKKIVARNPSAPNDVKQDDCRFCDPKFFEQRETTNYTGAKVFANDFPYGPFFHYVVLPDKPIHAWSDIRLQHLENMNMALWEHLCQKDNLRGSAGIRVGLNSSVKHLVLGKTTRSSAGATIAHVHKQVWGMAPGAVNLGNHLDRMCREFRTQTPSIDYLDFYLRALREAEFIIWEDDNVALYVPFGQISIHETQIMIKRSGTCTYLDLTKDEIKSFSKAEYIATLLYRFLNINSFNEVMLSTPFTHETDDNFRLINTFITREVDIAVSELNLLYVVDRHPTDTISEIRRNKNAIEKECGEKILLDFKENS